MAFLQLKTLIKSFGPVRVVQEFNLDVARGEFVSLLGPSGCGKTTVLRMVAGFESPTSGQIIIDGADVTGLRPSQRNVGLVFQSYALFPNLTVAGNIAFGLKVARKPSDEIATRVKDMLKLIGLPDLGERYPFELSGGQQQRVALARALAVRPRVLLLDEPLSALDAKIRVSLRDQIRDIQRELGITTIFVTHDQEEALSISDRVVVMNKGRADQIGTPHEIYNKPKTEFVANFVGTLNAFTAVVTHAAKGTIKVNDTAITVPHLRDMQLTNGAQVKLGLRPEALHVGKQPAPATNLPATVEDVHFLGSVIRLRVRLGDEVMSIDTFNRSTEKPPVIGGKTTISLNPTDLILIQ